MVTYVFLSVECTKYVQTMQNQFLICLFLRGKYGEIDHVPCVRCSVVRIISLLNPWSPQKICSSFYFFSTVDWNLSEKWPNTIFLLVVSDGDDSAKGWNFLFSENPGVPTEIPFPPPSTQPCSPVTHSSPHRPTFLTLGRKNRVFFLAGKKIVISREFSVSPPGGSRAWNGNKSCNFGICGNRISTTFWFATIPLFRLLQPSQIYTYVRRAKSVHLFEPNVGLRTQHTGSKPRSTKVATRISSKSEWGD